MAGSARGVGEHAAERLRAVDRITGPAYLYAVARQVDWPDQPLPLPVFMDPNVPVFLSHDLPPSEWPYGLEQSGYVQAFRPGSNIGEFVIGESAIGWNPPQPTMAEYEAPYEGKTVP